MQELKAQAHAARKIQKVHRGKKDRVKVQELKAQAHAARKIQKVHRGKRDRDRVQNMKTRQVELEKDWEEDVQVELQALLTKGDLIDDDANEIEAELKRLEQAEAELGMLQLGVLQAEAGGSTSNLGHDTDAIVSSSSSSSDEEYSVEYEDDFE